jgi:hypothetical protein
MLEEIDVENEKELEQLLIKEPRYLKYGIKILKNQFPTSTGPLDILFLDDKKVAGIIEIKKDEDDGMLIQALRYFDYVNENLDAIKSMFKDADIDTEKTPRIVLLAKSFSPALITAVKNISEPSIELYTYFYFKLKDGSKELLIKPIEIPLQKKRIMVPFLEDHINYLKDDSMKETAKKYIEAIKDIGKDIEVVPTKYYLGFQFKGKLIVIMDFNRNNFEIRYPSEDTGIWESEPNVIGEAGEPQTKIIEEIEKAFKSMGGEVSQNKSSGIS